jgi:hypothetical protein
MVQSKHQAPNKFQIIKLEIPNKTVSVIRNWCSEIIWDLEFVICNLELQNLFNSPVRLKNLGRLDHIGRLRPFRAFGNLELYRLSCTKRFKAIPRDPRIVNKHIIAAGLLDESISLLCVKPLHYPFCQGPCPPFSKRFLQRHLISLINLDVKIFIFP